MPYEITRWFRTNVHCPVCRYDIRDIDIVIQEENDSTNNSPQTTEEPQQEEEPQPEENNSNTGNSVNFNQQFICSKS